MNAVPILEKEYWKRENVRNTDIREHKDIAKYCQLGKREQALLEQLAETMNLSVRAYHKVLKVARTIADMEGKEQIEEIHLTEALCYRVSENPYWK